jgi:hypothetical protein
MLYYLSVNGGNLVLKPMIVILLVLHSPCYRFLIIKSNVLDCNTIIESKKCYYL